MDVLWTMLQKQGASNISVFFCLPPYKNSWLRACLKVRFSYFFGMFIFFGSCRVFPHQILQRKF